MLAPIVNLPLVLLRKAARAVQEREAALRAAEGEGGKARAAGPLHARSPLDVPSDYEPGAISLTPAELAALLAAGGPVALVDVRDPAEQAQGRIPHAYSMPGESVVMDLAELPVGSRIVVYGNRAGRHARRVAVFMRYRGLDDTWVLDGGWPAWQERQAPATS